MTSRADALAAAIESNAGVDLHAHSRHSDGSWTPTELVGDSWRQNVRVMALTDHDTVAGQVETAEAAGRQGMLAITGIEVTTHLDGRAYHLLCYDFNPSEPAWGEIERRRHVAFRRYHLHTFEQVSQRGYDVSPESAMDENGNFVAYPVAQALVNAGRSPNLPAARSLLRGLGLPFPYEIIALPVADLGELLEHDSALCSVAHPAREEATVSHRLREADLVAMKDLIPLVALEAHHPYHRPTDVVEFANLAASHGLLVTCGSDAHGWQMNRPPRPTPAAVCGDFLRVVLARWRAREAAPSAVSSTRNIPGTSELIASHIYKKETV
ncbi:MAG TPA: PHP domain-containing protein [Chloroflexota bacterium]|nr:PHP domain-containing protein [Chloroflexota bacterium]